ncbi:MAG: LPS export ABC transporter permease LptF [Gammaproteobacteria bacterium]|nr:LPS export ABC transporter permease LptF [Gammaproteobacteria bacterium]
MGIIDRLLLRDIIKTLAVIVAILALLFFSNALVKYLGRAASGVLSADIVLIVAGLELVKALGQIVPPALFFSVLWVLGRMHRDSEMIALAACGYGTGRIVRAVLITAAPLALLVTVLVMEVLPWSKGYVAQLKAQQSSRIDITGIRPGRFNEFRRGELVVYAERLSDDGTRLDGVFVQDRQHGRTGLVSAASAYQAVDPASGSSFIVLTDGRRTETGEAGLDYRLGRFDEYAIRIPDAELRDWVPPQSARHWRDLLGSEDPGDWAELQYRLSVPLGLLAFAVLAVPLARSPPRSGVYGRLTFAVLLYFTFLNLQKIAERLLAEQAVPAWLGMWWLPALMVVVTGLVVMFDSNRFRVRLRRWLTRRKTA